ncbi:ATP-binding protein [candidate division KSB1 bacterium]
MNLFVISTLFLILFIAGTFLVLIKRSRIGYRFQARLTLLLLLLTLVPSVLLILVSAELINRSFDALVANYLEETLDSSIAAIREQLTRINSQNLDRVETFAASGEMRRAGQLESVYYAFRVRNSRGIVSIDTVYTQTDEAAGKVKLDGETVAMILEDDLGNILYQEDAIFESYRIQPDSTILVVGMQVDTVTIAAVGNIQQASGAYGLLQIFSEGILDRNTAYAAGIVILLILTLIAVFVASILSKSINNPIRTLVHGFQEVSAGNLNVSVESRAKDEMGFLLKSFNRMVSELKQSQQRLVQSERLAAWRDVARQLSHEIKNPLTPIQLSLHRLRKKVSVPPEHAGAVEESFETIDEEIEALRQIATEFSEFARLPKPQLEPGNINDIVRSAAVLYEKNTMNIPVITDLHDAVPATPVDADQMKRVLINLIKNGIEASENRREPIRITTLFVRTEENEQYIKISVSDSGCGMDDEVLKKIFDPYFTTKKDGTGLGMPIIKRIVEEHGGEIEVFSSVNEGTTVTVILPVESGS